MIKTILNQLIDNLKLRANKPLTTAELDSMFPAIISDDDYKVVEMMEKYGGSFVKALSTCFYRADSNNFKKQNNSVQDLSHLN